MKLVQHFTACFKQSLFTRGLIGLIITSIIVFAVSCSHVDDLNRPVRLLSNQIINLQKPARLPFRYVDHLIYLDVVIANRKLTFLLDSGANYSFINSNLATELYLPVNNLIAADVNSINGSERVASYGPIKFAIQQVNGSTEMLEFESKMMFGKNGKRMNGVEQLVPTDGTLGADFFQEFTVIVDYQQFEVRLYPRSDFDYARTGYVKVPTQVKENSMTLDIGVADESNRYSKKVAVDTGCKYGLVLIGKDSLRVAWSEHLVKSEDDMQEFLATDKQHQVDFGFEPLKQLSVTFDHKLQFEKFLEQDQAVGLLCNQAFETFEVGFDFAESCLYFKNNNRN